MGKYQVGTTIERTWIKFVLVEEKPKTSVYHVRAMEGNHYLGEIKWYSAWRTYAFLPEEKTVFEPVCLGELAGFINQLMDYRKEHKDDY